MSKIYKAEVKDIPKIQNLAKITWPITFKDILSPPQLEYMVNKMYSTNELWHQIEGGKIFFWIVEIEKAFSGFMSYELHSPNQSHIKIHKLYIHPTAQGKGLGKELLKKLEEFGKVQGFENLTLNVNKYNLPAINFYKKQGFIKVKEEIIPIGNGYIMDDYVYSKKISAKD